MKGQMAHDTTLNSNIKELQAYLYADHEVCILDFSIIIVTNQYHDTNATRVASTGAKAVNRKKEPF